MNTKILGTLIGIWLVFSSSLSQGESALVINQAIESGEKKIYDHQDSVVLSDGFWARAGSDVTVAIASQTGFYIDKTPLDEKDRQYTDNDGRSYVIAGCVPHNLPVKFVGSTWVQCNGLDYVKDKVEESKFISCLDIYPNGVLQAFHIKEVNNRTWQSFRFSCADMQPDGKVGSETKKADFLFNFEKEGKLYNTSVPTNRLSVGIFEMYNQLELRPGSLLTIALEDQKAQAIYDAGEKNQRVDDFQITDKIPPSYPLFINYRNWLCPPGKVITGAAIGHIPNKKDKHTRPVYILAECRELRHGP